MPPTAIDSERAVVGCVTIAPADALATLRAVEFDTTDMLDPFCADAVSAAVELGAPLDVIVLADAMSNHRGALERLGVIMRDDTWSMSTLARHLDAITTTAHRRRVIERAATLTEAAYSGDGLAEHLARLVAEVNR